MLVSGGVNSDTADVVVTLGNEIELRTTINGPTAVSFAENGATRVATFTASSDDDRDGVEWIISGSDAQYFTIDTPSGALRFHIDPVSPNIFPKLPDFEDPDDSRVDNSYSISLQASAGSATTSSLAVTVTVGDVDEAGAISLSTARPGMGSKLTATLTDPDEVTAGTVTWQWERSSGPNAWTVISGATSDSYEPVAADTNAFLRVTATYNDEHDSGHKIEKSTANVVTGPHQPRNCCGDGRCTPGRGKSRRSWRRRHSASRRAIRPGKHPSCRRSRTRRSTRLAPATECIIRLPFRSGEPDSWDTAVTAALAASIWSARTIHPPSTYVG